MYDKSKLKNQVVARGCDIQPPMGLPLWWYAQDVAAAQ
jgi:hypothetical protein